jgi:hypothetical protein
MFERSVILFQVVDAVLVFWLFSHGSSNFPNLAALLLLYNNNALGS